MMDLTPSLLRRLIDYEPESGAMHWRSRSPFMFWGNDPDVTCAVWNRRLAGRPALTAKDKDGYLHGSIFGRGVKAHRIAWVIVHGAQPDIIDHINHDKTDNRIANLRSVTNAENHRNMPRPVTNSTGVVGVRWSANRWEARIKVDGADRYLGRFLDFDEAVAARAAAEAAYGFHPNHGGK